MTISQIVTMPQVASQALEKITPLLDKGGSLITPAVHGSYIGNFVALFFIGCFVAVCLLLLITVTLFVFIKVLERSEHIGIISDAMITKNIWFVTNILVIISVAVCITCPFVFPIIYFVKFVH